MESGLLGCFHSSPNPKNCHELPLFWQSDFGAFAGAPATGTRFTLITSGGEYRRCSAMSLWLNVLIIEPYVLSIPSK